MPITTRLGLTLALLLAVGLIGPARAAKHHLWCHSHDDLGWLETIDGYYEKSVRSIFTTTLDSLEACNSTDPRTKRKFVYSEVGFLKKFLFEDSTKTQEKIDRISRLIAKGQWDWVNGGISMADSACTHFEDIASNYFAGQRFLKKHFNSVSKVAWQLDPFGHSRALTYLARKFGMKHLFFIRISDTTKALWGLQNNLDFIWKVKDDHEVIAHLYMHYNSPSALSCDRDCNPAKFNQGLFRSSCNGNDRMYRYDNAFFVGDDFAWSQAQSRFNFIDHVLGLNPDTQYSTPREYAEYFDTAYDRDMLMVYDKDFFVYRQGVPYFGDSWSGYFTTKPRLKYQIRRIQKILRDIKGRVSWYWHLNPESIREQVANFLADLQEEAGIFLHHDSITGTAMLHVDADYFRRIADIERRLYDFRPQTKKGRSLGAPSWLGFAARGVEAEADSCDDNEVLTGLKTSCVHFAKFLEGGDVAVATIQGAGHRDDQIVRLVFPDPGPGMKISLSNDDKRPIPSLTHCNRRKGICEVYFEHKFVMVGFLTALFAKSYRCLDAPAEPLTGTIGANEDIIDLGLFKLGLSPERIRYIRTIKTAEGEDAEYESWLSYRYFYGVKSGHYILSYKGNYNHQLYNTFLTYEVVKEAFLTVVHIRGDKVDLTIRQYRDKPSFQAESLVRNHPDFKKGIDVVLLVESPQIKNYNRNFVGDSNGLLEEKRESGFLHEDNVFPVTTHARVDAGIGQFGFVVFNDRAQGVFATNHGLGFYVQRSAENEDHKGNPEVLSVNEDVLVEHSVLFFHRQLCEEAYLEHRNLHDTEKLMTYIPAQYSPKEAMAETPLIQLGKELRALRVNFEIVDKSTVLFRFQNMSPTKTLKVPVGDILRFHTKKGEAYEVPFDYVYGDLGQKKPVPEEVFVKPLDFYSVVLFSLAEEPKEPKKRVLIA